MPQHNVSRKGVRAKSQRPVQCRTVSNRARSACLSEERCAVRYGVERDKMSSRNERRPMARDIVPGVVPERCLIRLTPEPRYTMEREREKRSKCNEFRTCGAECQRNSNGGSTVTMPRKGTRGRCALTMLAAMVVKQVGVGGGGG